MACSKRDRNPGHSPQPFAELYLELSLPLYVAHVDLKSAFDSVDRSALWLALRGIGIPDTPQSFAGPIYTDARIRIGSTASERFSTPSV
jgi:hypothetical protein